MKVKVEINSLYSELNVILKASEITQEVEDIKNLLESYNRVITGYRDDRTVLLQFNEIYRVYTENQKVFAITNSGKYLLKMRLFERGLY